MSSFDDTMRMQALSSIHTRLKNCILEPPRKTGGHKEVDVKMVKDRLEEVQPFWHAYLNVAKPHEHYNFNNMGIDERNMYLSCMFWYGMLDNLTKVGAQKVVLPIQGGTA